MMISLDVDIYRAMLMLSLRFSYAAGCHLSLRFTLITIAIFVMLRGCYADYADAAAFATIYAAPDEMLRDAAFLHYRYMLFFVGAFRCR